MANKYTDEELLESLRHFYETNNRAPKQSECTKTNGMFGLNTYKRRFGTWPSVLALAGMTPNKPKPKISDEELLQSLADFYTEYKVLPRVQDCANYDILKGKGTYSSRFGSFTTALEKAGLPVNRKVVKVLSDEELLDSFKRFYLEEGRAPKHSDCSKSAYLASHTTYSKRFGSFTKAINLAGLVQNSNNYEAHRKSDKELLDSLSTFFNKTGDFPGNEDFKNGNIIVCRGTYRDRFGSYSKAVELAGLLKDTDSSILLGNLQRFYVENGRQPSQEECKTCIYLAGWGTYCRRFGSLREALILANVPVPDGRSAPEQSLYKELENIYSGPMISGDRKILKGLELDIVFPELKLAIEFNGLYWHSSANKDTNYHIDKTKKAEAVGYRLIHVFEHEWEHKRDIVLSRISNLLGNSKVTYARKCTIREVSSKDSKEFLEANHIQGNANGSIRLGLYLADELVALMTFCKSRFSTKYEWELLRYCNKLNTSVVGGASRLFKHFIKQINPNTIGSYSDLKWNTGDLYKILGFEHSHISKPNYWYFKGLNVESRVKYQKHKLKDLLNTFDSSCTEYENMLNNGFNRFFDCGNNVYKWDKARFSEPS